MVPVEVLYLPLHLRTRLLEHHKVCSPKTVTVPVIHQFPIGLLKSRAFVDRVGFGYGKIRKTRSKKRNLGLEGGL